MYVITTGRLYRTTGRLITDIHHCSQLSLMLCDCSFILCMDVTCNISQIWTDIISEYIFVFQLQIGSGVTSASKNKSKGFLALLRSKSVAFFLHFLLDVATLLTYLSTTLQRTYCTMGEAVDKVHSTIEALEKYKTRYVMYHIIYVPLILIICFLFQPLLIDNDLLILLMVFIFLFQRWSLPA